MTPVEFLARLASLVPPPRIPLVRYFGVLAPNSPYRDRVVPKTQPHDDTNESEKPNKKRASNDPNESLSLCSTLPDDDDDSAGRTSRYIDWATLMKRTFGIDPLRCPKCEARMKVLAVISQPEVVSKILAHVGLPVEPDVLADGCTLAFTARSWAVAHLCSLTFLDSGQQASLRPLRFDVTGEPIPDWAVGTDPEGPETEPHGYERGPPCALTARTWAVAQLCSSTFMDSGQQASLRPLRFDGVDPPGPDDVSGE